MKLQRLSEYFGVSKSVFKQKGIFDAIIGVDSGFYLDPTLLKNTRIPEFKGAYKQIENHYEKINYSILGNALIVVVWCKERNIFCISFVLARKRRNACVRRSWD